MDAEQFKIYFQEHIFGEKFDMIVASDPIYNSLNLDLFTNFLGMVKDNYTSSGGKMPVVLVSHKGRNEKIDDMLVGKFEGVGFYGEQIDEKNMHPIYANHRIDIFELSDLLD